ncbi:MAG TPA: GNAT family N-acetyltransferase [Candidatus Limnocylindrales bacterium]|nr:GNAT family N-acetyltransferase [Candidatus Limnocylindrales bacterium]
MSDDLTLRGITDADYERVIGVLDDWWGGREMIDMLPRLFFTHFADTSFLAEDGDGSVAGFICGFLSPACLDEAYVHFIGVAPRHRRRGVARKLYERFAVEARRASRTTLHAVTSPVNEVSIAAHRALGFEVEGVHRDYDGPGRDRVVFVKRLDPP